MTVPLSIPTRRVSYWWWLASLLALGVAGYSLRYPILGEGAFIPELAESFRARLIPLLAAGGPVARLGFFALAVATLATLAGGYVSIRRREVTRHREWMLRSYALIFAAVTLRIWLPILIIAHQGEFLPAYRWVAWVSWVPNILWAEWRIRPGWRPAYEHAEL